MFFLFVFFKQTKSPEPSFAAAAAAAAVKRRVRKVFGYGTTVVLMMHCFFTCALSFFASVASNNKFIWFVQKLFL